MCPPADRSQSTVRFGAGKRGGGIHCGLGGAANVAKVLRTPAAQGRALGALQLQIPFEPSQRVLAVTTDPALYRTNDSPSWLRRAPCPPRKSRGKGVLRRLGAHRDHSRRRYSVSSLQITGSRPRGRWPASPHGEKAISKEPCGPYVARRRRKAHVLVASDNTPSCAFAISAY